MVTKPSPAPERLVSLDAYRGFVMLAMASSAFGFMSVLKTRPEVLDAFAGTRLEAAWQVFYRRLCYQFDHVEWTGCGFWDLIQPSFMFMVGVALPFSFSRRNADDASKGKWFVHVLLRSLILVLLGIFLSSTSTPMTNFTFMNVLSQIGLGYPILCLLHNCRYRTLLAVAALILAAHWGAFSVYEIPESEREAVTQYIKERKKPEYQEMVARNELKGLAAHWNMHTNLGAAIDRRLLNLFPRNEEPWRDQAFWINDGGYQTINFIPSLVTMIFGLMAGKLLRGPSPPGRNVLTLLAWGAICFVLAMAADTTIWPVQWEGASWSLCPAVKRLWTPTWTIFSTGWCFVLLAAFYGIIDVRGWKRWAWPMVVVGMNSIAMYVMAQTMKTWAGKMFVTHARAFDAMFHRTHIAAVLTDEHHWSAPILMRVVEVTLLWLICVWLYRRRIFIRV